MWTIACCVIYMAHCPQSFILQLELGHQARHNIVSAAQLSSKESSQFLCHPWQWTKNTPPKSSRKSSLSSRDSECLYMILRVIKEEWVCESLCVSLISCDLYPYMWLMKDWGEHRCPEGEAGKESTLKTYIMTLWCKFLFLCTCSLRFNTRKKE